jgi:hypothetical protein
MPLRSRCAAAALFALALSPVLADPVLADIDVEVRNGDGAKGTLDPGDEVETFRFAVPAGAKLSLRAKPGRRGPAVALDVLAPGAMNPQAAPAVGKGAALTIPATAASGSFAAAVTSLNGTSTGDYSFSVKWTTPRTRVATVSPAGGASAEVAFGADAGARLRVTASAAKGSAALPRIDALVGPGGAVAGFADALGGTTDRAGPAVLAATGDHALTIVNDGGEGAITVKLALTPPKARPRKIDVTARKTGTAGDDGAYARVVDAGGGAVTVPAGVEGLEALVGTSVDLPAGALPAGTAILIGTAPDLNLPGQDLAQIGPPVLFGPEGTTFGTKGDPKVATVSIPVNLAAVGDDTSAVRVFTRDAKGRVTEVPAASLDFVTRPGYVTFPTPHFSSYVTAAEFAQSGSRTLFTYATGLQYPRDTSFALTDDSATRILFVADGTPRVKDLAVGPTGYGIGTWAGGGTQTTDGTPRLQFQFPGPVNAVHSDGDAVYAGTDLRVYRIDTATGSPTIDQVFAFAGDGTSGDSGDLGPATAAQIRSCADVLEDTNGDVWIVDRTAARVRRVNASSNIETVAGTGTSGSNGDSLGLAATQLDAPAAIAERYGTTDMFVAERGRVRILHLETGTVETLAGDPGGATGCAVGGEVGTSARFDGLTSVAFDIVGNRVLVASGACHAIYAVSLATGEVRVLVGTPGTAGSSPDGAVTPATRLSLPAGLVSAGTVSFFLEQPGSVGTTRLRQFIDGE